jgi:putative nucleotidyltransferase with HDIG domain
MANLPINREQAMELLKKYNPKSENSDWVHFLESEAIMKELAKKLNENQEYYSMLGLLHDVDWGITKNNVSEHLTKAPEILKDAGFDEQFIDLIVSHGCGFECAGLLNQKRTKNAEFALAASETLTGLIHAYARMRSNKVSDMESSGLKKKFKDKAFAAGVNREIIKEIENLGITLEEFFEIGINGIKSIKEEVGLI